MADDKNKGQKFQDPKDQEMGSVSQKSSKFQRPKQKVDIIINPNTLPGVNMNDPNTPGAARNMPTGKGGIVSHYEPEDAPMLHENRLMSFSEFVEEMELGFSEEVFTVEGDEEYEDWGEPDEEGIIYEAKKMKGKDPCWTGYQMVGMKNKNGRKVPNCVPEETEHQGRKVKLGKPFMTPGGPKKRAVYVKNAKGNVVKVNFGDPNMRIRRSNPAARHSFRARHGCDVNPGPRWKAKYWSCKQW